MTNETGIERVFYIYNLSGCSCLWPYFHPPLLYTELCEVLWVPKLHRFPNKAGLCPGGTSWGLFRSSIGPTRRERPRALWFWQLLLKLVLEAISVQLHAQLALGCISMAPIHHLRPRPVYSPNPTAVATHLAFLILALRCSAEPLCQSPTVQTQKCQVNPSFYNKVWQTVIHWPLETRQNTRTSSKNPLEATVCSAMLALRREGGCIGI